MCVSRQAYLTVSNPVGHAVGIGDNLYSTIFDPLKLFPKKPEIPQTVVPPKPSADTGVAANAANASAVARRQAANRYSRTQTIGAGTLGAPPNTGATLLGS